ncbi:MAG: DUF5317 family protein [Actinomycetota bacterium]|nr:DUF5317 family protein [Actinomycetota bacterium]
MLLTPLAIALGVVLGLLRGGSLTALKSVQVRFWPLLLVGLVLQSAEQWPDVPGRLGLYLVGVALLMAAAMLNVHFKGATITGFGLTLNLMIVLVNGYVPLRVESFKVVGGMPSDADPADYTVSNGLWRFEDDSTLLRPLGDIVPVPVVNDVISFGDLIIVAGLIVLTMHLLLRRPRRSVSIDELFLDEVADASAEPPVADPLDLRDTRIDLVHVDDVLQALPTPSPVGTIQGGNVIIIESDHG